MIVIKNGTNQIIYNQSTTESGVLNVTDLMGLTTYTISVEAVNNENNMSRSEEEFTSIAFRKLLHHYIFYIVFQTIFYVQFFKQIF